MHRAAKFGALAALGWVCCALASAAPIDLTQDTGVIAVGTYTYYSRSTISPFTAMFYPGPNHSVSGSGPGYQDGTLSDASSPAAPVPFASGDLTNPGNTSVGSWRGVVDASGRFDILFDLGAAYDIETVNAVYADYSGFRWTGTQAVLTATSLTGTDSAPQDSDFTAFASAAFGSNNNATAITTTFDGTDTTARYILFRGDVSASGSNGNNGGQLNDINIFGEAVLPEPGAVGVLVLTGSFAGRSRRRTHS